MSLHHVRLEHKLKSCWIGLKICEDERELESPRYESLSNQWIRLQRRWYKAHQQYYNPIANAYSRHESMRGEI